MSSMALDHGNLHSRALGSKVFHPPPPPISGQGLRIVLQIQFCPPARDRSQIAEVGEHSCSLVRRQSSMPQERLVVSEAPPLNTRDDSGFNRKNALVNHPRQPVTDQ